MIRYILRRLLLLVPVMLVASFLSFSILFLSPGDPAELILRRLSQDIPTAEQVTAFNAAHGLDQPLPIQYLWWLSDVFQGDMGLSLMTGEPVFREYRQRFGPTVELFLLAQVVSIIIAFPLGILSAVRANSKIDHICRLTALSGMSVPNFWLALLLIYFFAVKFRWLPAFGYGHSEHIILPVLTLGIAGAMSLMRLTRTSLLEVLRLDYVKMARSKGLREKVVITKHVLRNALIPVVTAIGIHLGHMTTGTVIIETIFAWPGIGSFLVQAVEARDFPVVQGFVLMSALIFVLLNLAVDILYVYLDPRITYQEKGRAA